MVEFYIKDVKKAEEFVRICQSYIGRLEIDVHHGRFMVDGCSILGVMSFVGYVVNIEARGTEPAATAEFYDRISELNDNTEGSSE